jgi:leucyl/phenylalanyl-tRNA--protein transferase
MLRPDSPCRFPDARSFDKEGLIAIGGDLCPARLLAAYGSGIFPWYAEGYLPMWWSPDPRGLLCPERLHTSRSLRRVLRRAAFQLTWNRCFLRVMTECGQQRAEGSWVIPEMVVAYERLHRAGHAHSLEVWDGTELIGGTYGVQVGGLFAAESMFHRRTDMSKVALTALVRSLFAAGIELLDVQFATEHLVTLGAFTVPRAEYLARLAAARGRAVDLSGLVPTIEAAREGAAAQPRPPR